VARPRRPAVQPLLPALILEHFAGGDAAAERHFPVVVVGAHGVVAVATVVLVLRAALSS
jgi:hypothetical protein